MNNQAIINKPKLTPKQDNDTRKHQQRPTTNTKTTQKNRTRPTRNQRLNKPMTYKQHGPYLRNLKLLPKKLRKEIQQTEKRLEKLSMNNRRSRREYKKQHNKLERLKNQADSIQPTWRKTRPELCQNTS